MRRLFSLVKVMTKASLHSMSSLQGLKNKKNDTPLKRFGKWILILILIIYVGGLIYVPSRFIIKEMIKLGQPGLVMNLLYAFAPLVMLFFGILSIPGVFYFSKDIEDYLPLPLTSKEILLGKYITAYLQTLLTTVILFLPIYVNYFTLVKPGILFIFTAFFALLFMPLIPLSLSLVIVAVLMRVVPFLKNKDLYIYISTGLVFIPTFIIVFTMSSGNLESDILDTLIQSIQNLDDSLFRQINLFFPTSHLFTLGVLDFDVIRLLGAAAISILSVLLALLLIGPLYFSSVIGIDEKTSKRKRLNLNEMDQGTKVKSFTQSFMLKDFRNIIRTPSFAINYFSIFVILPIMMLLPLLVQKQSLSILLNTFNGVANEFHLYFYNLDLLKQIDLTLLAGLGLGIFISNFEASSSTAISREGAALKDYLTLPIKLSDIAHAKARLSFLISSVYASVFLIFGFIFLRPRLITIILFLLMTIIGLLISTYLALLIDVRFPSLNWETEQQAVKGNFIQIIVILPLMFVPLIFVFLSLVAPTWLNILITSILAPLILFILIKQTTKAADTKLVQRVQNL